MIRRIVSRWPDDARDVVRARLACGHVIDLVDRMRPWCDECSRARAVDALHGRYGRALSALVDAAAARGSLAVQLEIEESTTDGQ